MKHLFTHKIVLGILGLLIFAACSKDSSSPAPAPTVDFSSEIDAEDQMKVNFTSAATDAVTYYWDFGDGQTATTINPSVTYISGDTYTVTLTVTGGEGTDPVSISYDVTVVEPPFDGGLIVHGEGNWTITDGVAGNVVTVDNKGFLIQGSTVAGTTPEGEWENVMVWQSFDVEAGKSYQFDAFIQASGSESTWTQLYLGTSEPVDGGDYGDNKIYGVSSWGDDGSCIGSDVSGSVLDVGCEGAAGAADGVFTFDTAQTLYFVIKTGSQTGSHNLTWYNISFTEM